MPRSLEDYVAENSRSITNIDSRAVDITTERNRSLAFGSSYVVVDVAVELYTRSTGESLIFGHSDDAKGFGRGTFGDDRGEWSLETDAEASAIFTRDGRKAVAEALNGQTGAVESSGLGTDTTAATTSDAALGAKYSDAPTFGSVSGNTLTTTAIHDSTSPNTSPGEVGIFDGDGRLLARITIDPSTVSVGDTDEVRAVVLLTFDGSGVGDSVITDDGEAALAASLKSPKASVGPADFAFGSGSTDFVESDSSLSSETFRNGVTRNVGRDRVQATVKVVDSDITSGLSEVGLFDNQNRMIWATTFLTIPSDSDGFDTSATIVIQ